MSTRLDLVLEKFPGNEEGIRLLAARDPSGNLKYLDWGAKVLASGQALAPETADVIDLFHQFRGQAAAGGPIRPQPVDGARLRSRRAVKRIHPDLYAYRPADLAGLRTTLFAMKRARDRKRRQRERLYKLEGPVEAEAIYDSPDLVVRHIKNKAASVHHGLSTKWCISMLREGYFEDYEAQNATFFFFERKAPKGDEFDKVALMLPRSEAGDGFAEAFTALDRRVDMMVLAKVHGPRIFDIFREVHERSAQYPGSAMCRMYAGTATASELFAILGDVARFGSYELPSVLEAIACNDAAPEALLVEVRARAPMLYAASMKRSHGRTRWRGRERRLAAVVKSMSRTLTAAMAIHTNVSPDLRAALVKELRRRHVKVDAIERVVDRGRVGITFGDRPRLIRGRRHCRRRPNTVKALRQRAGMYERLAKRIRRRAMRLQKSKMRKASR